MGIDLSEYEFIGVQQHFGGFVEIRVRKDLPKWRKNLLILKMEVLGGLDPDGHYYIPEKRLPGSETQRLIDYLRRGKGA